MKLIIAPKILIKIKPQLAYDHTSIYSNMMSINNFEELCEYGVKYINEEVDEFMGQRLSFRQQMESRDQQKFLIEINKLKFFTRLSQPAVKCNPELVSVADADVNLQYQREYVTGFMRITDAKKLYELLKDDTFINIYTEFNNEKIENEILTIIPMKVRISLIEKSTSRRMSKNKDFDESTQKIYSDLLFKGAGLTFYHPNEAKTFISKIGCNLRLDVAKNIDQEVVRVAVVDKIYNRKNDYMWLTLIAALKKI